MTTGNLTMMVVNVAGENPYHRKSRAQPSMRNRHHPTEIVAREKGPMPSRMGQAREIPGK
ncbi:hypothetical protein TIFTF001_030057 [Ficus carica]|uniref:Uncharacterized protein n=1 Tax=Ficus carica TaxID=3494 RepID=A0AA88DTH6_FICCA|nr:hypothetical protein TIFTF001_030057 [Ficus carica]